MTDTATRNGTGRNATAQDGKGQQTKSVELFSELARKAHRQLLDHQALIVELARQRREAVAELRACGLSQRAVAEVLGVSHHRVYQLDREASAAREGGQA